MSAFSMHQDNIFQKVTRAFKKGFDFEVERDRQGDEWEWMDNDECLCDVSRV
jgi:hypothetical protein